MSADRLREAARLMRERAEAASKGPWRYPPTRGWSRVVMGRHGCLWAPQRGRDGALNHEPDGYHIASWHPAVALAVADWLDTAAADLTAYCADETAPFDPTAINRALAVANAYLGSES